MDLTAHRGLLISVEFSHSLSVGGILGSHHLCVCRLGMSDPPTSLVGFWEVILLRVCRLGMNDPPTPLVGFLESHHLCVCRLGMNDPPTSRWWDSWKVIVCVCVG